MVTKEMKIKKTKVTYTQTLSKRSAIMIYFFLKNLTQWTVIIKIISSHNSTSTAIAIQFLQFIKQTVVLLLSQGLSLVAYS